MSLKLQFHPLTEENLPLVRDYLISSKRRMCDYSATALYMWKDYCKTAFALYGGICFIKCLYFNGKISFFAPLGGDVQKGIDLILEYCKETGTACVFAPASVEDVETLRQLCRVSRVTEERDLFDYVYNAQDMATFAGRHYDGHRNHIRRFTKLYPDHHFEELDERNYPDALRFFQGFDLSGGEPLKIEENNDALETLKRYRELGLLGGLLYAGGQVAALSLGDIQNDTLFIHVERSDKNFKGCSQMIVREYARHFVSDNVKFINRMEDEGNEGLRKSKLAYHPAFLLEKYTVEVGTR